MTYKLAVIKKSALEKVWAKKKAQKMHIKTTKIAKTVTLADPIIVLSATTTLIIMEDSLLKLVLPATPTLQK